jgi:hypothetical protein
MQPIIEFHGEIGKNHAAVSDSTQVASEKKATNFVAETKGTEKYEKAPTCKENFEEKCNSGLHGEERRRRRLTVAHKRLGFCFAARRSDLSSVLLKIQCCLGTHKSEYFRLLSLS